jgi:hypothetical protein
MKKAIALTVFTLAVTGCSGVVPQPSASTTTAMPAAEHWFKVSWSVEPDTGSRRKLTGRVQNEYGSPMTQVQLLAQALDANKNVVGQKIVWVPGALEPFGRRWFEIRGLPAADDYRVSVWSFEIIQSDDGQRR